MIHQYFAEMAHNPMMMLAAIAVVFDTVMGILRAIREKKFNSNFGIDGAIRKSAMIVSLVFLMFVDFMVRINLIGLVPQGVRETVGLEKVGLGEFFCVIYILYEAISILKNLYLCGVPVPKWAKPMLEKLLTQMTGEIKPSDGRTEA